MVHAVAAALTGGNRGAELRKARDPANHIGSSHHSRSVPAAVSRLIAMG